MLVRGISELHRSFASGTTEGAPATDEVGALAAEPYVIFAVPAAAATVVALVAEPDAIFVVPADGAVSVGTLATRRVTVAAGSADTAFIITATAMTLGHPPICRFGMCARSLSRMAIYDKSSYVTRYPRFYFEF